MANSGAWLDIMEIANAVADAGHDRAWARVVHALANMPRNTVQVFGVEITDARETLPWPEQAREAATHKPPFVGLEFRRGSVGR